MYVFRGDKEKEEKEMERESERERENREICYKEFPHIIIEAEKSHDLHIWQVGDSRVLSTCLSKSEGRRRLTFRHVAVTEKLHPT